MDADKGKTVYLENESGSKIRVAEGEQYGNEGGFRRTQRFPLQQGIVDSP